MSEHSQITIGAVVENLNCIEQIIKGDKYVELSKSDKINLLDLFSRLRFTRIRLLKYKREQIVQLDNDIIELVTKWKKFDETFTGQSSNEFKLIYGLLVRRTLRFLSFLNANFMNVVDRKSPIDKQRPESVQKNIDDINEKRQKLKESLDKEKEKKPANDIKIAELQEQLDRANNEFVTMRARLDKAKRDSSDKESLRSDIDDAFRNLGNYTENIDKEVKRQRCEYKASLIALGIISCLFIIAYFFFIAVLISKKISIKSPVDLLPYSLGVGMFVGLIAISLYMKGRANKISIELSTRLFNIHYLEGLMKMTNKLAIDYSDSVQRINVMIASLAQSYIQHIDDNIISEKLISKWENKEIKSNPYFKLLQEIKVILTKMMKK